MNEKARAKINTGTLPVKGQYLEILDTFSIDG
jgi:hypothetical protein